MNFQKKLEESLRPAEKAVRAFPWSDKASYAIFLAQTYYYVRHSTALLGRAARKLGPEHAALKARFIEHTKEESGHHNLAIEDLKHLGVAIDRIPEFKETADFYGSQYRFIDLSGATSLFGYILQLEMLAARQGGYIYANVRQAHGEEAANFMRIHSADDVEHVVQAVNQVLKFSVNEQAIVFDNFIKSRDRYVSILDHAKREAENRSDILDLNRFAA